MRASAFWDTSALVPLCVRQSISAHVIELYKTYAVVAWWAAPVEVASALTRLKRMRQLSSEDYAKARRLAQTVADSWVVIEPSNALRAKATELLERHDLRAADSFQLAAALEWCETAPQGRVFLTADDKLRDAALVQGFDALTI